MGRYRIQIGICKVTSLAFKTPIWTMAKLSRIIREYHFDILFGIYLHENISILVVFQKVIASFRS